MKYRKEIAPVRTRSAGLTEHLWSMKPVS